MKKRRSVTIAVSISTALALSGCQGRLKDLPDDPAVFKTGDLYLEEEDTGYKTIEYDDRVYIMYGGIRSKGLFGDLTYAYGDCLGYVEGDRSDRIYALANEATDEWLIEYSAEGLMEQPVVLREISKRGHSNVPDSVESFDYDYRK